MTREGLASSICFRLGLFFHVAFYWRFLLVAVMALYHEFRQMNMSILKFRIILMERHAGTALLTILKPRDRRLSNFIELINVV